MNGFDIPKEAQNQLDRLVGFSTGQQEGGLPGLYARWGSELATTVTAEGVRYASGELASLTEGLRDYVTEAGLNLLAQGFKKQEEQTIDAPNRRFIETSTWQVPERDVRTSIGTAWRHPIAFAGGIYDIMVDGVVKSKRMQTFWLPPTCVLKLDNGKDITKSKPNASKGTTKELWAFTDTDMVITGLILPDDPYIYPAGLIQRLNRWNELCSPIRIISQLCADNNVHWAVLERMHIEQTTGRATALPFNLYLTSDEDPAAAVNGTTGAEFGRGSEMADVAAAEATVVNFTN